MLEKLVFLSLLAFFYIPCLQPIFAESKNIESVYAANGMVQSERRQHTWENKQDSPKPLCISIILVARPWGCSTLVKIIFPKFSFATFKLGQFWENKRIVHPLSASFFTPHPLNWLARNLCLTTKNILRKKGPNLNVSVLLGWPTQGYMFVPLVCSLFYLGRCFKSFSSKLIVVLKSISMLIRSTFLCERYI